MRNLFLALVVANLGFAAWHSWFAESLEGRLQETEAPRRADALARGDAAAPTGPSARADGSDPLLTAETAAAEAASEDAPAAGERSLDAPAPAGLVFAEAQATVDPQVDTRRCVSVGPFQAAAFIWQVSRAEPKPT